MDLDATINAGLVKGFAKLTEAIFTPDEGLAIPCHIDIVKAVDVQPSGMDSGIHHHPIVIEALLSEILREPLAGETFTAGGTTYTVISVLDNDGFTVQVHAK